MPFPIAVGGILSAISGISSLVSTATDVVETITGDRPDGTEQGLSAAVDAMTPDQQTRFVATMEEEIAMYEAETERLAVQGGRVDAETLSVLSQEARDKVAIMRMTTRPLVTRRMAHVLMLPAYVVFFDMAATLLNWVLRITETTIEPVPLLASTFLDTGSLYFSLYEAAAFPAAGVVMAYMTLREIGKRRGDEEESASVGQQIGGSIRSILNAVRGA